MNKKHNKEKVKNKPRLIVTKATAVTSAFFLIMAAYFFFTCPNFPMCSDSTPSILSKSFSNSQPSHQKAIILEDLIAKALEEWVHQNAYIDPKKENDICGQEINRTKYKKLFVALDQMFKERICGQEVNLHEAQKSFERIFGRAFPEQANTFLNHK